MWTAASHNVLDKASINYCLTIIIEVTTIYFCKWKNFARLKILMHCKKEKTPKHSGTRQDILQPQCSPSKKFMCYVPKYPCFFALQRFKSTVTLLIRWLGHYPKRKAIRLRTTWNPQFFLLTQVLYRAATFLNENSSGYFVVYWRPCCWKQHM